MEGQGSATKRGKRNENTLVGLYIYNTYNIRWFYAVLLLAKLHCPQEIYICFLPDEIVTNTALFWILLFIPYAILKW